MTATAALLCERQEAELAALDQLPRNLWLWSLVHSQGALRPRLDQVEQLRRALIAGEFPTDFVWPDAAFAGQLLQQLDALELPGFCKNDADMTDTLLRSLLFHLDHVVDYIDRGASAADARQLALESFAVDWKERCGEMEALVAVFGAMGDLSKNLLWDMLRGLLRSGGWQEVVRISHMVEHLPELARVIRQLGRSRASEERDESSRSDAPVMEQIVTYHDQKRIVRVPDYPGETRGICRSGRVARMLPAEAMLLNHPRLRLIWHARHAERILLSYEDDEDMEDAIPEPKPAWRPSPDKLPDQRMEMGPIVMCVDTSGSMQGGAETVAKAAVLEAVRTAHSQKRGCHVFAFSGPDDIVELEIGVDMPGLEQLTDFMGQTFLGGTDICGPLGRALDKITESGWQLADLLIASDGEFGATPEMALRLNTAKQEQGLRVQGILIGDRETIGLLELTDDVFWVRDWRLYGTSQAESPVKTKSLTKLYFPGALRMPEKYQDASDAAKAVATYAK
jgi:uncharacterized protein with von Willebrand factor type A (vWA) domain